MVNKMIVTNDWNPSFVMPQAATDIQEAEDHYCVCQCVGDEGVGEEHADPLESIFHGMSMICIYPCRMYMYVMLLMVFVKSRRMQKHMRYIKPYIVCENGSKNVEHSTLWGWSGLGLALC